MLPPDLSVCIVNWNTREDLHEAIRSVINDRSRLVLEVVVLDNASTDGSAQLVRTQFPEVMLLESTENTGFARGYNRAVAATSGRYILILNPDTVVHSNALVHLVQFLDAQPEVGVAGPRLLNSDGSLQFSCRRFPTLWAAAFRNTVIGRLFPGNHFTRDYLMQDWDHRAPRAVDWVSGAALCVRRQAWEQVGGFDEGFFMYAEDMDWCLRARQSGWDIYYLPTAVITHHIGRSSDQRPLAMVVAFHRSMARFYRKHYAAKWPRGLRLLPLAGVWARAGLVLAQVGLRRALDRLRRKGGG